MAEHTKFSASVICMNPLDILGDVKILNNTFVDYLHIDIMDGHMVPRYGLYPELIKGLAKVSNIPLDIHVMTSDPEFTASQLKGCENIGNFVFHLEGNEGRIYRILDYVKETLNPECIGIVVNLSSNMSHVVDLITQGEINSVLFMAIHPGVLKQTSRPNAVIENPFVYTIKETLKNSFEKSYIGIDGGVDINTIPKLIDAGIEVLVGGSGTLYRGVNDSMKFDERSIQVHKNLKDIGKVIGYV